MKKENIIPNPIGHQVITYIIVTILICITILSVFWVITLAIQEGFLPLVSGIPIIIFFAGYASYIGLLVLRYRSAKVTYDTTGFTITSRGNLHSYDWSSITKTKYYGMFRVLRLSNNEGNTMYTIHGITRDNRKFIREVDKIIGYTTDVF